MSTHLLSISLALNMVCFMGAAHAQEKPEELVQQLAKRLRTCPPKERSDVMIKIGEQNLGADGKLLIPILLGDFLGDGSPTFSDLTFDEAVVELIATFDIEGLKPLMELLASKKAGTRAAAAYGLGRIGPSAEVAVPVLIGTLRGDEDARVRENVIWALMQIDRKPQLSVPAIAEGLEDKDPKVVVQACVALLHLGFPARNAVPQLIAAANRYERLFRAGKVAADDDRRLASLTAAAMLEPEPALAVPLLMRVLRCPENYSMYETERPISSRGLRCNDIELLAVERLIKMGPRAASAIPLLIELARGTLAGQGRLFRRPQTKGKTQTPPFDDGDSGTKDESYYAYDILVAIGPPARELIRNRLLPQLEAELGSKSARTRVDVAAKILSVFPDHPQSLDELVKFLKSERPILPGGLSSDIDLRIKAVAVAARAGRKDERVTAALRKHMQGPPSPIKLQAARSMSLRDQAGRHWRPAAIESLRDYYGKFRKDDTVWTKLTLTDVSRAAIDSAHLWLGKDATPFFPMYVGTLPWTSFSECRPAVGEDDDMQRVVDLGAAIVPTLVAAVEARFPADQQYNYNGYLATKALGRIGKASDSAVPALCKVLKDSKNPVLRREAAVAIGRIGSQAELAIPALTAGLDDPWASVRAEAARALQAFGSKAKSAAGKLRTLEKSEFATIREAVRRN